MTGRFCVTCLPAVQAGGGEFIPLLPAGGAGLRHFLVDSRAAELRTAVSPGDGEMNKIESAIVYLLLGITSVIAPISIVAGILVHLYSVFIAYRLYGVFGGLVTLFLPVLSEIFLFIKAATIYPIPQNLYCLALIGYVVLVLFLGLLASVATWLGGREDAKESKKRTLELREELIRQYQDQQKVLESNKD